MGSEQCTYEFNCLRGTQSGNEFYAVNCQLRLVPRIFLFNEDELPVSLRTSRSVSHAGVQKLGQYIADNPHEYVLSSLVASVDGNVVFEPYKDDANPGDAGRLLIPMTARLVINDGQHRRAAIEWALEQCPDLGQETIAVLLFPDPGLERAERMCADLNQQAHSVKPRTGNSGDDSAFEASTIRQR